MTSPATAQAPIAALAPANAEHRELARWQRKLLPFMSRFLVVMAMGFFVISLIDVYAMRNFVKNESTQAIRVKMEELLHGAGNRQGNGVDIAQQALLLLEADALDKRYRQASALLMSRIWTRQLAFITGMVLAFIGAVFIIGKLSESNADVTVGAAEWKAGISSTSPGLILAFFGTVLMGVALVVQPSIEVQDRPVYLMTMRIVKNVDGASDANTHETLLPDPFGNSSPGTQGAKQKTK
jgi:hypothetical protein